MLFISAAKISKFSAMVASIYSGPKNNLIISCEKTNINKPNEIEAKPRILVEFRINFFIS